MNNVHQIRNSEVTAVALDRGAQICNRALHILDEHGRLEFSVELDCITMFISMFASRRFGVVIAVEFDNNSESLFYTHNSAIMENNQLKPLPAWFGQVLSDCVKCCLGPFKAIAWKMNPARTEHFLEEVFEAIQTADLSELR